MRDIYYIIDEYFFKQRDWIESYNVINTNIINNTLNELKEYENTITCNTLYHAIHKLAHIDHIKYIVDMISLHTITDEMRNIIKDIIQLIYIRLSYNIDNIHLEKTVIYNHYVLLLDEYAALFGVVYSKNCRLETITLTINYNPTYKLYVLLELDSIGYTLVTQIRECIAKGAVLDRPSCGYKLIPLWYAIDNQCSLGVVSLLYNAHYDPSYQLNVHCSTIMGEEDNDTDYIIISMTLRMYIRYIMGLYQNTQTSCAQLKSYWNLIVPRTRLRPKNTHDSKPIF